MERTTVRPRPGDELELRIESLAFGGAGIARLDGYVVFVSGAVPGDRVTAVVRKSKRAYAQGDALEVLEPGPERIEPRAFHPGAPWQVLPYERQLKEKQSQVHDALRRIGGLDRFTLETIEPAAEVWRYRNKLEYTFGVDEGGRLICGFHARGRWDQIVEVGDCLLASERVNSARQRIVEWCREQALAAYDRRTREGLLRNLVIREGRRTGSLQVRLVTAPGDIDGGALARVVAPADGVLWTQLEALGETTEGGRTRLLAGVEQLEEVIGSIRLRISPEAFFQTNTDMAERLYQVVREYAGFEGGERVYDLFCGIGTIALVVAQDVDEVWGIELVEQAVADAIANAERNQIHNVRFFAGDVRLALAQLREKAGAPDIVIVDPPRAGLSRKVIRRIVEAAPRKIVYVSCNPTTLAPNAAQLVQAGYELRRVRPVDMFPQTPHIECVALLERSKLG